MGLDRVVGVVSPKAAYNRAGYRMAYDAIDGGRTRKKRKRQTGTADTALTEAALADLRDIARDMSRNNPIAKGILKTERDGVIGDGVVMQANTGDDTLNLELEAAWKEKMATTPCDITGRFNFNQYIRKAYLSYRRDGDFATIFTQWGLQAIEGEQIGTPYGRSDYKHLNVINGVAFSKKTGRLIGYYIGKPNKWGYIQSDSVKKFTSANVHHMFNPERFSFSRGEPILTASITELDSIKEYFDAELVAAKVNACFTAFISRKSEYGDAAPPLPIDGVSSTGYNAAGKRLEKIEPGMIMYGEDGEDAKGIGMTHPGTMFDSFVLRMLAIIGRPLCMPLMLITGDFSGATFMNARLAYQKVQEVWTAEQADVVKPFASRTWRWFVRGLLDSGEIKTSLAETKRMFAHTVLCRRWPYVDPFKEAKADEVQLKNGTTNRTIICARQGVEFVEVAEQGGKDKALLKEKGLIGDDGKNKLSMEDTKGEKDEK